MSQVFLDSGIFIAFLNRRDRYHTQALALFKSSSKGWCTSSLVRSECYSWFLHREGEQAARTFRYFLDQIENLEVFETSPSLHESVAELLERLRGTRLTYVDAASLALLERHSIPTVWSTDHHLAITGVEVLPRS